MKAKIKIDDNDDVIVVLEGPVLEKFLAQWGLHYPEGYEHPMLVLAVPGKVAIYENYWDEKGIIAGRTITACLADKLYFFVQYGGERVKVHINKRSDIASIKEIHKRSLLYEP